ncbi:unnamed protein product [Pedinophyceae sp. YPF-701]|nr:unnamed protein product [Pedinophyceae sp. YPF-701]
MARESHRIGLRGRGARGEDGCSGRPGRAARWRRALGKCCWLAAFLALAAGAHAARDLRDVTAKIKVSTSINSASFTMGLQGSRSTRTTRSQSPRGHRVRAGGASFSASPGSTFDIRSITLSELGVTEDAHDASAGDGNSCGSHNMCMNPTAAISAFAKCSAGAESLMDASELCCDSLQGLSPDDLSCLCGKSTFCQALKLAGPPHQVLAACEVPVVGFAMYGGLC